MNSFVFVVPAFEAASTVALVVSGLFERVPCADDSPLVIVIDDGSLDDTSGVAARAGAIVLRHATNRGKGSALRTGFRHAWELGAQVAVTLDADGQHPPEEAWRLAKHPSPPETLLLGVRDLKSAGAPTLNQTSNRISNFFLSRFGRKRLLDTQCGLRRYPLERVLGTHASANGFAYEAEVLLTAARAQWPLEELPVRVVYPPGEQRITHFDNVRDPARMVATVLRTLARRSG